MRSTSSCRACCTRRSRRALSSAASSRVTTRPRFHGHPASVAALSEQSAIPLTKGEVYRRDLGGGFGRRGGNQDYVRQAVNIAKQFPGAPVKMIWSRDEDRALNFFRPISQCKLPAGLDDK